MKIKTHNAVIRIASFEDVLKETAQTMRAMSQGKNIKAEPKTIVFPDLSTLRTILTDERIRLLQLINHQHPASVHQLAKIADRKYANVYTDIQKLREMGLIRLETGANKTQPKTAYQNIRIEIPLTNLN